MRGLMMDVPLNVSALLDFAAKYHADTEIVSKTVEGPLHRYGYADAAARARRLANALVRLGLAPGDVVGTVAWNGYRHVELYYAISGSGMICHTINPRLFAEQIVYIINHAQDRWLFVDLTFVPLLEKLADKLPGVKGFVVMTDAAHMPRTTLPNALCYETLVEAERDAFVWPVLDENTASSLCYSSGTTGNPRGVLYSHRSTVLHSYAVSLIDVFGLSAREAVLPVVPMFHVNAWGLPYAAPLTGAKLVMPGPNLDGASLQALIYDEGVTFSAGVPTVWMGVLNHLAQSGKSLGRLERVVIGGSACPPSMIETLRDRYGVKVVHAWGMTEISPLGTANHPKRKQVDLPPAERDALAARQGRPVFGVDMKIVDGAGNELPWDGTAFGALKVRGPWVCGRYFNSDVVPSHQEAGWFETGDVATIDADGNIQIVDRVKDVIKSGGEWISSIELENIAIAHPAVREAAVIARPDAKWGERPRLIVALEKGEAVTTADLRAFYRGKVASWCVPDDVVVVDDLPHTATGKLLKSELRRLYGSA